jgi:hypothetical protein
MWADETADRAAIEATVAALNKSPSLPSLFAKDFANANELRVFLTAPSAAPLPAEGITVRTEAATVVISREPMGEAALYTNPTLTAPLARFVPRSFTFVSPDISVVVAVPERQFGPTASRSIPVLFVMRREEASWRIASFRVLSEAGPK